MLSAHSRLLHSSRRLARRFTPALALLLLVSLVVGGTHHHADGRGHESCVVCTVSHAPAAMSAEPAASPQALPATERLEFARTEAPAQPERHSESSRAPPSI